MRTHARALFSASFLTLLLADHSVAPVEARAAEQWEVTFALRVGDGNGKPATIRLALPPESPLQRTDVVKIYDRGMKSEVKTGGEHPVVIFQGRVRKPRRVSVTYRVAREHESVDVPAIRADENLPREVLDFLHPAPLFPSRSILTREFLEMHVAPQLAGDSDDVMRAIFSATRQELRHSRKGKSLVLDALRRRRAKRIAIERAFTTFLRCAGIPARFVEGFSTESSTKKQRVFWTEIWHAGRWWPASASRGWIGARPPSYVALTRDGVRPIEVEGSPQVTYVVQARRMEERSPLEEETPNETPQR